MHKSQWMSPNQRKRAATQSSFVSRRTSKLREHSRKCQTFSSFHDITNSRKLVSLLLPLLLREFLYVEVLMLVRDMTQWLEHMSSSEECSDRERDGAGCLNQQCSFHVSLTLPFILLKPLNCTSRQFFIQQGWGHRTEWLKSTVHGLERQKKKRFPVAMKIKWSDWGYGAQLEHQNSARDAWYYMFHCIHKS